MQSNNKDDDDPHVAGTKLGHYVFGKSLGKGTFGKVKMAEHILTKESVAIKILEKARIKDRKDIDRISREIKILKKVRHPNIIQLYEIIETETELYLIMEYCVNGELFDYIVQHQRLHEKAATRIYQQLVSGIDYIHKSGICHRDLKPENLLLDFDKTLKIVDFGLSNLYEPPDGMLKTACGSPCYAAPEMIAGKKYHGIKSDIWSSGVVLYAMVCGFLPFEDPKTSNLYKKIMAGDYKLPRFLSTDCSHFISKILQTDPDQRYGVEHIRDHPWYRQHSDKQPVGLFPGKEGMPVEDSIYEQILDEFGFDPDYAVKCIEANRHNNITATYHLLYKKALRQKKPFTNVSHVTGSLDRAAIARYERKEAANIGEQANNANQDRVSRYEDWNNQKDGGEDQAHKRGQSTNYNNYKNAYVPLQSVNGGPETANLNQDQTVAISAQKRYKMELQAEIGRMREKASAKKKSIQQTQQVDPIAVPESGSERNVRRFEPQAIIATKQQNQKRTERIQISKNTGGMSDMPEQGSPEAQTKRPQNRVNIIQIQTTQQQTNNNDEEHKEEPKQNSQVIGSVPPDMPIMSAQTQKLVTKYSSQPGRGQRGGINNTQDQTALTGELDQQTTVEQKQVFQTLEDHSAQKVSTISSLVGTNSVVDSQAKKSAHTTTKGSQIMKSYTKHTEAEDRHKDFLNSSMPITLPNHQHGENFSRMNIKPGGRKMQNNAGALIANHQMRYRKQKTPSVNAGHAIDAAEFAANGEPSDIAVTIGQQRSKKNQTFASLNATQALVNNSMDVGRGGGNGVFSNIVASTGQSSKNVAQISMNQRQLEQLANNLNKTQHLRQSGRGSTDVRGTRYNNRASIGAIIGHQKQLQAQRNKQKYGDNLPSTGHMPNITNETIDSSFQHTIQPPSHIRHSSNLQQQHPVKHRQSFKQTTTNQSPQLVIQEQSPQNHASILARRAGSHQWRNPSNLSNQGGRDSVNSNHSHQHPTPSSMFQQPPQTVKRGNSITHASQNHVPQATAGDYDFATVQPHGTIPFQKQQMHHQPGRIITSSESGQVGKSKPLQLTQIYPNNFGQTSENKMNLVNSSNTIDFHHYPVSNPQSNSQIYHIQQNTQTNKVQQLKNRKGINQSIDLKPQQVNQIKQGLLGSTQLGPSSQVSRKSAQSRQFAFESDLSNNYASQISGWVNQSILPSQHQAEILDHSAASLKHKQRGYVGNRRDQQDSQSSNYNMQQAYSKYQQHPGMPPTKVAAKVAKGRGSIGPMGQQQRIVHSVIENHKSMMGSGQQLDQSTGQVQQQFNGSSLTLSKDNLAAGRTNSVGGRMDEKIGAVAARISLRSQNTPGGHHNRSGAKGKSSQAKKNKVEMPQSLVQKGGSNRQVPFQGVGSSGVGKKVGLIPKYQVSK